MMNRRNFWIREKLFITVNSEIRSKASKRVSTDKIERFNMLLQDIVEIFKEHEFDSTRSVANRKTYDKSDILEYHEFEHISLLDHILNTVEHIEKNAEPEDRDMLILYAMLHDIGKSNSLRRKYKVSLQRGHEYASGEIIEHLVDEYDGLKRYKEILLTIAKDLKSNEKHSYYYKKFHIIDSASRRKEKRG